ncbi:MAG: type II CRISPR-associated endonuclease Cas1 [Gammaproteobacteria bacterium]|nr:type II CRISPR-associated endonuclease Cas1 [Gammaproteobacteria bacterium]MCY4270388.1 type II CRISPR-associated endonuclease Cas1 [Gammaproteobacteria bacterium]
MVGQIVEITEPGHWLKKSRGFLQVHNSGKMLGQVPLDDIQTVLVSVPGCVVSSVLMDQLAQRNIPLVICGENYLPSSWTLPLQGAVRQFQVMRAQAQLSEPRRKRYWQKMVKAKIANQSDVLSRAGEPCKDLTRMIRKVKSGDPENIEAQAARAYWQRLMGAEFRRDRESPGLNAALNYGYTVLRACIARGVSGAGLHPSFSIHHKNPRNPMNLVDDLVEPFRPIADFVIWRWTREYSTELTRDGKLRLASLCTLSLPTEEGFSPLSQVAARCCRSFAKYCLGEEVNEVAPSLPTMLDSM